MHLLDGNHNLADLRVGLHVAVRLDDFGEWEGLVDTRLKVAGGKMVEDVLPSRRKSRGIADHFEESVPLDGEVLAENGE